MGDKSAMSKEERERERERASEAKLAFKSRYEGRKRGSSSNGKWKTLGWFYFPRAKRVRSDVGNKCTANKKTFYTSTVCSCGQNVCNSQMPPQIFTKQESL